MGIFGPSKIIQVASVVYNLAGEEASRPNFRKAVVARNVLSQSKDSISDTLRNAYLSGPSIQFRQFFRWANIPGNYDEIGVPVGEIVNGAAINAGHLKDHVPHPAGTEVWVQRGVLDDGDFSYWAEEWILNNQPEDFNSGWTADFNETTGKITINFEDNSSVIFTPINYDYQGKYVFAYYNLVEQENELDAPLTIGSWVNLGTGAFPSTTGWTLYDERDIVQKQATLRSTTDRNIHVRKTYSDGAPAQETLTPVPIADVVTTTDYETGTRIRRKVTNQGGEEDMIQLIEYRRELQDASVVTSAPVTTVNTVVTNEVVGGVTITTTTKTTTTVVSQNLVYDRKTRIDTREVRTLSISPLKMYIYKVGSGKPGLDGLVAQTSLAEFFPVIPVRLQNQFLSSTFMPDAYAQAKKAYKKATGAKIEDLVEKLEDNDKLSDLDNIYVVFGVSLNTLERAGVRYIYNFFDKLRLTQAGGPDAYNAWLSQMEDQEEIMQAWLDWKAAYDYSAGGHGAIPPEPPRPTFTNFGTNQVNIKASGESNIEYDARLKWTVITAGTGTGLGKTGAITGSCWIEQQAPDALVQSVFLSSNMGGLFSRSTQNTKFRIYWQRSPTSYTYLDVIGAVHENHVYGGKAVIINSTEALEDDDESGFLVPLHYETWRELSIADSTQLGTCCCYLVINCYVVKKLKWYQTGIFKILLIIVIAIIGAILTGGAGIGLLGSNLALGGLFGLSGLAAAIVGAVINALAGIVLSTVLEKVASSLGILGSILSSIFMFLLGNIGSIFQGGSLALNWGSLLNIGNLLKLTNAILGGVVDALNMQTVSLGQDMMDLAKKAQDEIKKIQQAFFDEFGYGAGTIDPFMLVESSNPTFESSETFLTRTLMTGSDMAEMSLELLYNFSELTLTLPDAFSSK